MNNPKLYASLASTASQNAKILAGVDNNMFETHFVQNLIELTAEKCIDICLDSTCSNDDIKYAVKKIQYQFGLEK